MEIVVSQEVVDCGASTATSPVQQDRHSTQIIKETLHEVTAASKPDRQSRDNDEDEYYSVSPEQKARSQQRLSQSLKEGAHPAAEAEREQHSHATTTVPDSFEAYAKQVATTEVTASQPKSTPSNLQAIAQAALPKDIIQTPDRPPMSTSGTRIEQPTSHKTSASSHTTMQSSSKGTTGKLKMPTKPMGAAELLRAKKARESGGMTSAPGAQASTARQTQAGNSEPAVSKKTVPANGRSTKAKAKERDDETDTAARAGAAVKTTLRGAMQGGTQENTVDKLNKGKGRAKDHKATAKTRSNKGANADDLADTEAKPVRSTRGRPGKAQSSSDKTGQDNVYDVPTSPVKKGGRDARAKAKTQPIKSTAPAQAKARKAAPRKSALDDEEEDELEDQIKDARPVRSSKSKTSIASPKNKAKKTARTTPFFDEDEEDGEVENMQPAPSAAQSNVRGAQSNAASAKATVAKQTAASEPSQPRKGARKKRVVDDDEDDEDIVAPSAKGKARESGLSTQAPIEISDNEKESSPCSSEPAQSPAKPQTKVPLNDVKPSASTRTPLKMRSSPPLDAAHIEEQQEYEARQSIRQRKTPIVAFDKSGPRNQGALPDSASMRTSRSSMPPGLVSNHKTRPSHGPSSMATSVRTTRSNRPKPSNVAPDIDDAIAGFKTRSAPLQVSTDTVQPAAQSPDEVGAAPEELQRDAVFNDDFDGPPFVEPAAAEEPTESQIAMPPPQKVSKEQHVQAVPAMQSEMPADATASKLQRKRSLTPEPETKRVTRQSKAAQPSEEASSRQAAAADKKRTSSTAVSQPAQESRKRNRQEDDTQVTQPSAKAQKRAAASGLEEQKHAEGATQATQILEKGRKRAPNDDDGEHTERLNKRSKAQETVPQPKKPPTPKRKPPASLTASVSKPQAHAQKVAKRETQKRQSSQGSNIDYNGSPAPRDLEVPHDATVLETFSQQNPALDEDDSDDDDQDNAEQIKAAKDFELPPSHQSAPLSSNSKRMPMPPDAESNVMSTVRMTEAESRSLLEKERSFSKIDDPFDAAEEASSKKRQNGIETSAFTTFTKQIARSTLKDKDAPVVPENNIDDDQRTDSTSSPGAVDDLTQDFDLRVDDLRACTAFARGNEEEDDAESDGDGEDEDTDKTLVDTAEAAKPTQRLQEASAKKTIAKPTPRRELTKPDLQRPLFEPLSDDMLAWSKELKPHQLSLFDELVKCGQRIVECFVEMEDSVSQTLLQLHQRKLRLLRDDEKLRAKRYDQLKSQLKHGQRETKRALRYRQTAMQEATDSLREQKLRQRIQMRERESANQELEAWLDKL